MSSEADSKLAVDGGPPVRGSMLPYGRQEILEEDIQAVVDVLRSDWLTTGPKVAEFEEAVAARVGAKYGVSFSSGTAALHGAVFTAGLGPGDEAVTTPLTFCATANCLLYQGARPIFADVRPDTLNIDPDAIAAKITPRTKALIPVDYAGHPADLDDIMALAEQHGLTVIEDACHALGASYSRGEPGKGRPVGSIAHMTVFSFHPVKHVAVGEGGMVVTNDERYAKRLRTFRNHGIDRDAQQRQAAGQWYYEMVELGYNYRLSDIASALGVSQLRRLDANLERRRGIAAQYTAAFQDLKGVTIPTVRPNVEHAWHLYPIRVDGEFIKGGRGSVFNALREEGIGVNVHYVPVHLHPYYQQKLGHQRGELPVAEYAYEQLISLPMFHSMTYEDALDVITALAKVTAVPERI